MVRRVWSVSGVASFAAIIAAFGLLPADAGGDSPADIAARYADGREGFLRAAYLEALSVGFFLVFVAVLSALLRRREPDGSPFSVVVAVAGSVAAALQLVSYGLIATLAYRTAETGNEDVIMAVYDASSLAYVLAGIPLGVFVAAASLGVLRTRVAPAPVGWLGLPVAAALIVSAASLTRDGLFSVHGDFGFVALSLFLLWLLAASISLVVRPDRVT